MNPNLPKTPGSNPRDPRIVSVRGRFGGGWMAVDPNGRVLGGPFMEPFSAVHHFPDLSRRGPWRDDYRRVHR